MRLPAVSRWPALVAVLWSGCERPAAPTGDPPPTPVAVAPRVAAEAPVAATPPPAPEPPPLPQAGRLQYYERILGAAGPSDPLPMIVAIHGLGDDPENFSHLFDTFPEPARLIAPRAPLPAEEGGWSWFPLRARDPDVEGLSRGIQQSADLLAESVAVLTRERPTIGRPIVTGFSQGGMLTLTLAVHHPERFSTAVAVGGWLPPPLWPNAPDAAQAGPHIAALHGTADAAVRFEPTQRSVQHLQSLGYAIDFAVYEGVPHVITPEMHRDLFAALIDGIARLRDTPPPGTP